MTLCTLNQSSTSTTSGGTPDDNLSKKINAYTIGVSGYNPTLTACNLLGDLFSYFSTDIDAISKFISLLQGKTLTSFVPSDIASALLSGYKRQFPTGMKSLQQTAAALYQIYKNDLNSLQKVAIALKEAYISSDCSLSLDCSCLSSTDRDNIGTELVRIVLEDKQNQLSNLSNLGNALLSICFSIDQIPMFLKDGGLLTQAIQIGLVVYPVTTSDDLAKFVELINTIQVWTVTPCPSNCTASQCSNNVCTPTTDQTALNTLNLLYNNLNLKNNLMLFGKAFALLKFTTISSIIKAMQFILPLQSPPVVGASQIAPIVGALQAAGYKNVDIALAVFSNFNLAGSTADAQVALLINILQDMNPPPTNADIVNIVNSPPLSATVNLMETLVKILDKFKATHEEIAAILKDKGQTASQIASQLLSIGSSYSDIGGILSDLQYDPTTIAQSLSTVGASDSQIAAILAGDASSSPEQIASALSSLNMPIADIVSYLKTLTDSNALIGILKNLGATDGQILALLNISGMITSSLSTTGQISGTVTPLDLAVTLLIDAISETLVNNGGIWSITIDLLNLTDNLYSLQLVTAGITIARANLVVSNGSYVVFPDGPILSNVGILYNTLGLSNNLFLLTQVFKDFSLTNASDVAQALNSVGASSSDIASVLNGLGFSSAVIAQSLLDVGESPANIASVLMDPPINATSQEIAIVLNGLKIDIAMIVSILQALGVDSNVLINILKNLGEMNSQIIRLLNIEGTITIATTDGWISGTCTPSDLQLELMINPTISAQNNNGNWSVNIVSLGLGDNVYPLRLMTSDIVIVSANLIILDGFYITFAGDLTMQTIANLLEKSNAPLVQQVKLFLILGQTFDQIKVLLNIQNPVVLGQVLGQVLLLDNNLNLNDILSQLSVHESPEFAGTMVGNTLKVLEDNNALNLYTAKQVEEYIRITKLDRDALHTALSIALNILGIPNVLDIFIGFKHPRCQKTCVQLIERDISNYVKNDNASFVYKLDTRKAIGGTILQGTLMSYSLQNLVRNYFAEDSFRFIVSNLKNQTGEGKITIKITYE